MQIEQTSSRSSVPVCPDAPPTMFMFQRMGTFIRVHLGQRAGRLAQGCSHNTQHQTRQKRRTTDAGPRTTAPRKTSTPTTTEQLQLLGRRPHGAPFTFQGLSRELMHAAHGCFVKARPARPVSAPAVRANRHQRFNRREDENARGTAQTHRAEDWKQPWRTRRNAPRPRATGAATSG